MAIISQQALNFVRDHLSKYYDSDFFPKPFEFDAIWHQWPEVVSDLTSKNVGKLIIAPPRVGTAPKVRGGFRVVHQLQPIDSLIYTALAAEVAEDIEAMRVPVGKNVACSYRIHLKDGSFFASGAGWETFLAACESLAADHEYVLLTDITDFYNQISLHRLNNAIELANPNLKPLADDLERFVTTLNGTPSKGVPVGPAASIVMSEAILADIDNFIINHGFTHTRYVDDIRVFGASRRDLARLLDALTSYLYANHRLTLSSEKTSTSTSQVFVEEGLHNPYADLKVEIFETLKVFNPYTDEYEEIDLLFDDPHAVLTERLVEALQKLVAFPYIDLGLARSVIRHARRAKIPDLAPTLLERFEFFAPVINDLMLYLQEITEPNTAKALQPLVTKKLQSPSMDNRLVRHWFEWYVVRHTAYLEDPAIRTFVAAGGNVETQAVAAITMGNVAWVRERKAEVLGMGDWARRAVFHAARVLPSDEREHWLKMCRANSPLLLDRLVISWVLDTA